MQKTRQFHTISLRNHGTKWETDLFEFGNPTYLIKAGYYSKFIELSLFESTTNKSVINKVKQIISQQGIPVPVISENGPPYSSEKFKDYKILFTQLQVQNIHNQMIL